MGSGDDLTSLTSLVSLAFRLDNHLREQPREKIGKAHLSSVAHLLPPFLIKTRALSSLGSPFKISAHSRTS